MRITTQMLDESARKAGLPINRSSLLDYVYGESSSDSLVSALPPKNNHAANAADKTKYEKQEKAADELYMQAQKFAAEGSDNIFKKADGTEIYEEAETLIEKYNGLLSAMKKSTGALNEFYKQSMKDLAEGNKEALSEIGITAESNGSLKLDKDKLESVSVEKLEQVLGGSGAFTSKLSFLASRVADNANAYQESVSGSYLSNGDMVSNYRNKYDFWG